MYLSELRLWNFRKYGVDTDDLDGINPGVIVLLNPGLNVLIGENDSGKTAIVDAIRHLLGAQSRECIGSIVRIFMELERLEPSV